MGRICPRAWSKSLTIQLETEKNKDEKQLMSSDAYA